MNKNIRIFKYDQNILLKSFTYFKDNSQLLVLLHHHNPKEAPLAILRDQTQNRHSIGILPPRHYRTHVHKYLFQAAFALVKDKPHIFGGNPHAFKVSQSTTDLLAYNIIPFEISDKYSF